MQRQAATFPSVRSCCLARSFFLVFFLGGGILGCPGCARVGQVLPLPLSVDFLRLVLAVIDDHARSQGQDKTASAAASAEGATATSSAEGMVVGERGTSVDVQHASGSRLFSIEDLPRLYHRPGVIVRSLARACAGDDASSKEVTVALCACVSGSCEFVGPRRC